MKRRRTLPIPRSPRRRVQPAGKVRLKSSVVDETIGNAEDAVASDVAAPDDDTALRGKSRLTALWRAVEATMSSVRAVLLHSLRTRDLRPASRELSLIQCKDVIETPPQLLHARCINVENAGII